MRLFRLVTISALIILTLNLATDAPATHGDSGGEYPVPEKHEPAYPNLGSYLDQLVAGVEGGESTAEDAAGEAPMHSGDSVAVTIRLSGNVDEVAAFLEENGGSPRNIGESTIEAYVPVELLGRLSQQPGVLRVREIIPPQPAQGTSALTVNGHGPAVHLSEAWNQAGISGQGVKVGIIEPLYGFNDFQSLMGTELPDTVRAMCYTGLGRPTENLDDCTHAEDGSDHGTLVAEAVMDIGPEVSLYIATPWSGGDLLAVVDWMAEEGVSVINYSVSNAFDGPGNGTSPYEFSPLNAVARAVDKGMVWVSAAGNHAEKTWFGSHSTRQLGDYYYLVFDGTDISNEITLDAGDSVRVELRWDDTWGEADIDLDLQLRDVAAADIVATSDDEQAGRQGQDPLEILRYRAARDGQYAIRVEHFSGAQPDWVQLMSRSPIGRIEHHTRSGSIVNPAESNEAGMLAVGAAPWYDTGTIESFSGRGPTPDGRFKPDIVGADCGETALVPLDQFNEGFCGTSQATPHVAGIMALVRQRFPEKSPVQAVEYLKGHAVQRTTPDPNHDWGHGLAQLPPPLPPQPSIISSPITTGPDFFTVEWSPQPADNREPVTSYDLRYIRSGLNQQVDANWTIMENIGASGALQHMVTELMGSTQYRVQVRGVNVWGPGPWSVVATVTTAPPVAPGPPTGLTADLSDDGTRATLSWTAPESTGGSPITGYRVESSDDGEDPWAEVYTATGDSTAYTDLGGDEHGPSFGAGMVRYYRVQAVNLVGNGPFSEPAPSGDPQLPPPAPTLSAADQVGSDWLSVSWIPSRLSGIEPSTSHDLRYIGATEYSDSSVDSDWTFVPNVGTPTSHTHRITGLLGSATYRVQVRGHNIWGMGEWSVAVDVTTRPPVVPEAPTGLTAALVPGEARVELSWVAPTSSGGAPITGYLVELSQDNGTSWAEVYTASEGATTYTDDGTDDQGPVFEAGDGPHYRVAAINSVGTGPFSEPVPSGDPLFINYDTNRNGSIDRSEVISAINDYLSGEGTITRADVIRLINLYLSG